ncbi:cysteine hydrolase family protein [Legionella resiliens]|uniref:Cysteine hydrolase family protein n=1 Tax=Legionella resiliens TaxID=2905958 RepID=A0ABS8X0H5_9GAMM|nr:MULTISPECIES: cysteine hydrolase family protein [unclassified Legionella]MCE0722137.1 cysteine hydrolase family protein [Legionella sp. 9fVS26]MCE3531291.1 cysteine hydrolase family protein [Legionella sp. 8cVS16]
MFFITPMNTSNELRLAAHLQIQEQLRQSATHRFNEINKKYTESGSILIDQLKKIILKKLCRIHKLALVLIDIQNDFVLQEFALYVPAGENTLIRNMALLDALIELVAHYPELCQQIEIITTQDAHVFGRTQDHVDAQIMAQGYGQIHTHRILKIERHELQQLNPENGQYGLHCLCGTIGAAISQPIEERLNILEKEISLYRFAKINFSAPEAGMKLKEGIDLSDPGFLKEMDHIYDKDALPFLQFFRNKSYNELFITGICGNICVQQAAEGLAEAGEKVSVVDPCVHYLVIPNLSSYDDVWSTVQKSYAVKGINSIELADFQSNPEWAQSKKTPVT